MIGGLIDGAMDFTVAPGYTKVGYRVRSLGWERPPAGALDGKLAVVTGSTAGLGLATAEGLAELGADVVLAVRNAERGERSAEQVRARGGSASVELVDLSSVASVREFARRLRSSYERLDILVNNAGVLLSERTVTDEGHETVFATNVLGMFVLTNELLPLLAAGAPSRVINVASGGMYTARLNVKNLESDSGDYDGPEVYARSKRAEVILTEIWAQRLRDRGITFNSMHPGWADTPGVQTSLPNFHRVTGPLLRSTQEGADTVLWLAWSREGGERSGLFWHDRRPRSTHRMPRTRERDVDRQALWDALIDAGGPNEPASETLLAPAG